MKQMIFFGKALMAALVSVLVTSCLSDSDNNILQDATFVRVNNDIPASFVNAVGMKLMPDRSVTAPIDKEMAFIIYKFDKRTVTSNSTSINISLLRDPYFFKKLPISIMPEAEGEGNAPLIGLNLPTIPTGFFDKNTIILPLMYKYKKDGNKKNAQNAEDLLHSFTLVYDKINGFENGVATMRLHHTIKPSDPEVKREDDMIEFRAFDFTKVLSSLEENQKITKVKIIIKENQSTDEYSNAHEQAYFYEYPFNK